MKWIVKYRTLFSFIGALLVFALYWWQGYCFEGDDPGYLLRMAFLLLNMRLTGIVFPFYYTPKRAQGVSALLAGLLLGYTIQCVLVRIRGIKDSGQ